MRWKMAYLSKRMLVQTSKWLGDVTTSETMWLRLTSCSVGLLI